MIQVEMCEAVSPQLIFMFSAHERGYAVPAPKQLAQGSGGSLHKSHCVRFAGAESMLSGCHARLQKGCHDDSLCFHSKRA
jgi:hypothetical protein